MRPWTGARALDGSDVQPAAVDESLISALPTIAPTPRPGMGVVFDHGTPEARE